MLFFIFIIEGDNDKFEFLYARWKTLMLNKAYGILRDYGLAQDAVSEAFIRVYKNLRKIDDMESGKTAAFLIMIVKNVSLTMLNKQSRSVVVDIAEYDRTDERNMEDGVISDYSAQEMLKLIDTLKDELKTPFLLRYAYNYSIKEIGKLLNLSENNVAVRVHRARGRLMDMMKKEGYAEV